MCRINGLRTVKRPMCYFSLMVVLGSFLYIKAHPLLNEPEVSGLDGRHIVIEGTIENKEIKNDKLRVYLKNATLVTDSERSITRDICGAVVYMEDTSLYPNVLKLGSRIRAEGDWALFATPMNEGEFDSRQYYLIRGYEGAVYKSRAIAVGRRYSKLREFLWRIKYHCKSVLTHYLSTRDFGTMSAIVLGDRTGLDEEYKNLLSDAGIAHILSLSGLHIAATGMFLFRLLKRLGLWQSAATGISCCLMVLYCVMTGMSTSAVRALIMFVVMIMADIFGRSYDLLSAAGLALILILLNNAYYLYDCGFLLSFGAIIGMGILIPDTTGGLQSRIEEYLYLKSSADSSRLRQRTVKMASHLWEGLWSGIGAGLSVLLATLPISATFFYQISLLGILINLVVIPLMSILLGSGFALCVVGSAAMLLEGFDIPARIGADIITMILSIYEKLASCVTDVPFNNLVVGKPELWQIVVYYALIVTACNWRRIFAGIGRHCDATARKPMHSIAGMIFSVSMVIGAVMILKYRPLCEIEVRNLYVGQGDCAVIVGSNMPTLMIDGGSMDKSEIAKYTIAPALLSNAVECLDYVFITHPDKDHISGILEILESPSLGISIRNLVISDAAMNYCRRNPEGNANLQQLLADAAERRIPVSSVRSGSEVRLGNLRVLCVWPMPGVWDDGNESSTVIALSTADSGFTAIFTGDVGVESEGAILSTTESLRADYLKVAHHGSKNSSSSAFLEAVNPRMAVISAGIDNSYGHPHRETLDRFTNIGTRIYRTDEVGEVITKYDGEAAGRVSVKGLASEHN